MFGHLFEWLIGVPSTQFMSPGWWFAQGLLKIRLPAKLDGTTLLGRRVNLGL